MSNVKMIRLVTGEVLMGDLSISNERIYTIKNPLLLAMQPDRDGKLMVNMMEYMPFSADKSFEFQDKDVMNLFTPNDGLRQNWEKRFSKIITPVSSKIITK